MKWLQKGVWNGPTTWIIEYLEMYKILNKVINFIRNARENLKWKLAADAETIAEMKTQKGILQGNSLLLLLFLRAIMPHNNILRKSTKGYKYTKSLEKVNHLIYKDDIKLFATPPKKKQKKRKRTRKTVVNNKNIQPRMEFCIEKCTMLTMKSEKRKTTEEIKLSHQESIIILGEKENH